MRRVAVGILVLFVLVFAGMTMSSFRGQGENGQRVPEAAEPDVPETDEAEMQEAFEAEEPEEQEELEDSEEAEGPVESPEEDERKETESITPDQIKKEILEPAISFHPGTAGSSLKQAQAAAEIMSNISGPDYRYADAEQLKQSMVTAFGMLSEEEQGWLKENLPGVLATVDELFASYPEIPGVFDDAGAEELVEEAMQTNMTAEDWGKIKSAAEQLI
ncbi:MAG: hypothetical protein IKS55_05575 [Oscillospiraceae bacterium]|nr:hypothetical protein [Oscillospiraceae bacterium]